MKGSKRKRGDAWTLSVYLGTDKNGKKQYHYETFHGGPREADNRLAALVAEFNKNNNIAPNKLTVKQYLDKWMQEYCEINLSHKTIVNYRGIVDKHLVPELGKVKLAKLQPMDIQELINKKLKSGLKPSTVELIYITFRNALNMAKKWQILANNPTDHVNPPRVPEREYTVLSHKQIGLVLGAIKEIYPYAYMPVLLASTLGLRLGESLGITWDCVDYDNKTVFINKQLVRKDGDLVLGVTKTGKSRLVSMPDFLVDILKAHRKQQTIEKMELRKEYEDLNLISCHYNGKPIQHETISRTFTKLTSRLGFKARFHDLRHSFATFLIESNIQPEIISTMLGHSTISITMDIYGHVKPSAQRQASELINSNLSKAIK